MAGGEGKRKQRKRLLSGKFPSTQRDHCNWRVSAGTLATPAQVAWIFGRNEGRSKQQDIAARRVTATSFSEPGTSNALLHRFGIGRCGAKDWEHWVFDAEARHLRRPLLRQHLDIDLESDDDGGLP